MRRFYLAASLMIFFIAMIGAHQAQAAQHCAQAPDCPKPSFGDLLNEKIKVEIKRIQRKKATVKKDKRKVIKKRKRKKITKIRKKKRKTIKKTVLPKQQVTLKKKKLRKVKTVAPSWQGLMETKIHFLEKDDFTPIPFSFILRFNRAALLSLGVDLETVTVPQLANILGVQPFQISSIQRRFLPGAVLNLTEAERTRLAVSNLVSRLTQDTIIKPASKAKLSWGLDRIDQVSLPLDNKFNRLPPRSNVRVYLLDSGVDATHPQFNNRIKLGARFVPTIPPTLDSYCRQHGTEMASLITGKSLGVAPQVNVIDVTILPCDNDETGKASTLIEGLNWVVERELALEPRKLALVNLSLTGPKSLDVNEWVGVLVDNGIGVVVAAGNQGQNACNYSPASAKKAITVGAVLANDNRWKHSNHGSCVKIYAPGEKVTTAFADDHKLLVVSTGTSAAAAHATGILANNITDMEPGKPMQQLLTNGVRLLRKGERNSEVFVQFNAAIRVDCHINRTIKRLKLRNRPKKSGRVLKLLKGGVSVELAHRKGDWANVRTRSGVTGWVSVRSKSKLYLLDKAGEKACGAIQ